MFIENEAGTLFNVGSVVGSPWKHGSCVLTVLSGKVNLWIHVLLHQHLWNQNNTWLCFI